MYRGTAIPGLVGAYIFGDVNGTVWALGSDGVVALPFRVGGTLSGFGMGPDGELYPQSLSRWHLQAHTRLRRACCHSVVPG